MRNWQQCGMIIAVLAVVATAAGALAPVRVAYEGRVVRTSAPVVASGPGTLVPLRAVCEALGGQLQWDSATQRAVVRFLGRRLEVDEQAHTVRLDGRPLSGVISPRTARGQLLVPIAAVERLFGVRGRWLPGQHVLSFAALPERPGAAGDGRPNAERPAPNTEPPAPASGLQLRLTSDHPSYPVGAPVVLTLTVTNPARSPVTLEFSSGQKYDFEVRRAGQVVWRWAADRMFTQALTSLTLGPGERLSFSERWNQKDNQGQQVPAGTYEAVATLTTMGRPQPHTAPITLRIGTR